MKKPSLNSLMALTVASTALFAAGLHVGPACAGSNEVKPLLVMIEGQIDKEQVFGAGIIFGVGADRLYIATANHVVRKKWREIENLRIQLRSLPGEPLKAELLTKVDRDLDLAVISVASVSRKAIPIKSFPFDQIGAPADLRENDKVFMIGYPNHKAWKVFSTAGVISEVTRDEIRFESPYVSYGHSGGGLYDREWNLIGMIIYVQAREGGIAVRIDKVLELVKRWGYPVQLAGNHTIVDQKTKSKLIPDSTSDAKSARLSVVEKDYETTGTVVVRTAPSVDSDRVATLGHGRRIWVAGKVEGKNWFRVEFEEKGNSIAGYVYGSKIKELSCKVITKRIDTEKRAVKTIGFKRIDPEIFSLLGKWANDCKRTREIARSNLFRACSHKLVDVTFNSCNCSAKIGGCKINAKGWCEIRVDKSEKVTVCERVAD